MPLIKSSSERAFKSNVKAEIAAGKPQAQALGIAYSVKRKARAFGGPVVGAPGQQPGQALAGGLPQMGAMPPSAPVGLSTSPAQPMQGSPMGVAGPQPMVPQMPPVSPVGQPQNSAQQLPMMSQPQFKRGGKVGGGDADHDGKITKGAILSAVPGRTDKHFTHVPSGSYVIPADIVSGRGEGNTIAGAEALQKLFKMAPYGGKSPNMRKGPGVPGRGLLPGARKRQFAAGGSLDPNTGKPVRVNLAGGEIVVPPENLLEAVHPDLKVAHEIMDKWVLNERKQLRKTLAKLPGPVRD